MTVQSIGPHYALVHLKKDMNELLRLFCQISILRRGPQDLPASPIAFAISVLGYFAITCVINLLLPPGGRWIADLLIDIAFTLVWYSVLMRMVNRRERFLQTATAVFGFQMIIAPFWNIAAWLARRFADDPVWQLPTSVIGLAVVVWTITVNAQILKSALEWAMPACVLLVIVQIFAGQALMLLLTGQLD